MVSQTREQLKASDPRSSVWVGASAGTGKTFVLTARVLRLMLSGSRPDKILCLTYTNTAAAEMAIRVNSRLATWVSLTESELFEELSDLLGKVPSEDQLILARKLFAQVLDVPGGLKIQTIHSFCQSLLGRFPIEANVTPHFTLLDDITINEQIRLSQDALLQDIHDGKQKELKKALDYLSSILAEDTFTKLMKSLAMERGGLEYLLQINSSSFNEILNSLKNILGLEKDDSRDGVLAAACYDENFDITGLKNAANILHTGTKTDVKRGLVISTWLNDIEFRPDGFAEYKKAFLTAKDEYLKTFMTKKLGEENPDSFDILTSEAERVKFIVERLKVISLCENCEAILRIGFELISTYNKRKQSHNVVDFDDLILKVRQLFSQPNIASWILYKLDEGLDHILIDEAQDTNPDQWHVIRVLALEFFSGVGSRDVEKQQETPRTVFAVGDVKQSIYSFQKALPEKFNDNRDYFKKQAADARLKFDVVPMNLSFRSTSAVLEVVDEVFKSEQCRMAISFNTDEILHDTHRTTQSGLVEIWETIKPEPDEDEEAWTPPIIQKTEHDPKRKVAERIADQIEDWILKGEILKSHGRPITAGDILIIVQKRKEFVHHMIRALKKRNINVAGLDRMKLNDELAVMDLIAVANFTLLPSDDLTLAIVLKSPLIGISEEDLFDLAAPRIKNQSLWAALLKRKNERASFTNAANYLTKLTNYADFRPPYEFFSYLLGPLRGRAKIIARLGEQANEPVDEFLNQAMNFEQNNISSMQGFLSWIERGDIEIKREMEQVGDMVRIMTTHGAKGLQAPIVFLPDSCSAPDIKDTLFWFDDKNERSLLWVKNEATRVGSGKIAYERRKQALEDENKRLLYVAMTRAEDRLYVTGYEGKNERKPNCWYDMVRNAVVDMEGVEEIESSGDVILRRENGVAAKIKPRELSAVKKTIWELPKWVQTMPADEPVPTRPLSPSRPDEDEDIVISPLLSHQQRKKDKRKYHRGLLIHKLLEILPELPAENREKAAIRYLSQDAHELSDNNIKQITSEVLGILNDPALSGLFGPTSRSEVPIVGQIGNYSLSGQVDRLAVLEDEILVIDYKTNRPPPSGVENIPKIYQRQMAAYKGVLQDIYPEHNVRSFLLWTDIGSLMEIPQEMLNKVTF